MQQMPHIHLVDNMLTIIKSPHTPGFCLANACILGNTNILPEFDHFLPSQNMGTVAMFQKNFSKIQPANISTKI